MDKMRQKINLNKLIGAVALAAVIALTQTGCLGSMRDTSADPAAEDVGAFSKLSAEGDISFDYYLYTPEADEAVPLVITFHGYGEDKNLPRNRTLDTLTSSESQAIRPCYVLAPAVEDRIYLARSERDNMYSALMAIADDLVKRSSVDPSRIYAMGNSFGGLGTVEFTEKYPEDVAAAIVMCPALSYSQDSTSDLKLMKDVPVWFAQATNDNVIPITISRSAVSTLEKLGAREVHLTEFTDEEMLSAGALVGYHQADFAVMADESFMEWLFAQGR